MPDQPPCTLIGGAPACRMLERIEGNGVRMIIVETASRFARDLMVQEVGHAKLRERGIDLIAADKVKREAEEDWGR
jgi:hypothetical protein